jgi:hypothetical protein
MRPVVQSETRPPNEQPSWPERVAEVLRRILVPGSAPALQPVPVRVPPATPRLPVGRRSY